MYFTLRVCATVLAFTSLGLSVVIPQPTGPYGVSIDHFALTDIHRFDPYAPSHSSEKRRVMCSAFIPQTLPVGHCPEEHEPYMPALTAKYYGQLASSIGLPNTTFANIDLQIRPESSQHTRCHPRRFSRKRYPLLIFSPGFGVSRLLYTEYALNLASQGYVVVTVDHPYDAPIVEFTDGTVIPAANISQDDTSLSKLVHVRAEDLSFVLNELPRRSNLGRVIDFSRVMSCGHSLGGATAAEIVRSDKRILGGINMDGRLFEPALSSGLRRPFLQVGRPDHRSTDPTWKKFWCHLQAARLELGINGTVHGSFTDLSPLAELFDLSPAQRSGLDTVLGTIPGHRTVKIMTELLKGFGQLVFDGRNEELRRVLDTTPEVEVVDGF